MRESLRGKNSDVKFAVKINKPKRTSVFWVEFINVLSQLIYTHSQTTLISISALVVKPIYTLLCISKVATIVLQFSLFCQ
ncbi:hypothetical protein S101395_02200 [Bacillus sonorensis]|uniref:Uncharacterized protein n=1 Tax=Bacillus sonorensis TaxID=119858 RepID=A0ABN5AD60_9BACI|nr:hypothetical protein S101395_02200 [Bacillus sonorensis]